MDTKAVLGRPYLPRVMDAAVGEALDAAGAVLIEGVRACGKTMTGLNACASYVFMDSPGAERLLSIDPSQLLEGARPRLLDEWQLAPVLWNLVRRGVDAAAGRGNFILTGSAVPADDATRHTGAGRILRVRQRTLCWWEKQGRPGGVSLADLFDSRRPAADLAAPTLDDVVGMLVQPGFPAMADLGERRSRTMLSGYVDEIVRTDIRRLADIRHEPVVLERLIAAIARSVATEVSYETLAKDVRPAAPNIKAETVASYVELLRRLFFVETQNAWAPSLRSRARLRTSPKLHLADPALAVAALGADSTRLKTDLTTLGFVFESAAVHDLMVLASPLGGEVLHYRDSNSHEIDAIVALPDGRWGAVEVKLGGPQAEAGATSLAQAIAQIDTAATGQPAFRLVVTGTGPTLNLPDGTITCPLSKLAP
ncbi:MAG: DUF4143 domain-containing protein [Bifidobacteriaceae bacterium]|nr:DUF4143 domain-containing protein [Bifidobacteriaceae bacterium]